MNKENNTYKVIEENLKIMTPIIQPLLNIIERWESSQLEDSEKDEIYSLIKSHIFNSNKLILVSLVDVVEDKLKIINDYPLHNEFVKGEKESFEFIIKYLVQTLEYLNGYENK